MACNPHRGFLCQKEVAYFLSYSGVINKSHKKPNNCMVGTDVVNFESRVSKFGVQSHLRSEEVWTPAGAENRATALGWCGNWHLQQAIVFAFAGRTVAVLWAALNELHAHFVVLELQQKPATHKTLSVSKKKKIVKRWIILIKSKFSYSSDMSTLIGSLSAAEALIQ